MDSISSWWEKDWGISTRVKI
ncbi:unnamed protein product [Linum tenue]|uniref:Uncharacterized protein n=1 Tax=Linum tenue TaxID=586396 RepID=A0AAV0P403_9ROSI|nr:unnamed protein product [Linum tenue]CAI0465312.1 unnamed protein product [Linum tenue]